MYRYGRYMVNVAALYKPPERMFFWFEYLTDRAAELHRDVGAVNQPQERDLPVRDVGSFSPSFLLDTKAV